MNGGNTGKIRWRWAWGEWGISVSKPLLLFFTCGWGSCFFSRGKCSQLGTQITAHSHLLISHSLSTAGNGPFKNTNPSESLIRGYLCANQCSALWKSEIEILCLLSWQWAWGNRENKIFWMQFSLILFSGAISTKCTSVQNLFFMTVLSNMAATRHTWLLTSWNMASAREKRNFLFCLI